MARVRVRGEGRVLRVRVSAPRGATQSAEGAESLCLGRVRVRDRVRVGVRVGARVRVRVRARVGVRVRVRVRVSVSGELVPGQAERRAQQLQVPGQC